MFQFILSGFLFCASGLLQAQEETQNKVNFLFVGDVMQHGGQIQGAYNKAKDAYDYRDCFQFVKPIISKADIAVANLEVTHAGKPYKGYPQFSAPPELSEGLVDAGFDVILTANNHSCDGGGKGVTKTLDVLDNLGVKHTGTFRSKAERDKNYPLMIEKNGLKVAILNYTYGTNGLFVAAPLIVNYIDSSVMKPDFQKAKNLGADIIVCTMHWGTEYQSLPNDYQKKWEAFCYRQGADMVIGGHPHVLQPVQQKEVAGKQRLTAWSLGNFVSNQRDRYTDGGIILTTTVKKEGSKLTFPAVDYYFTWVHPRQEKINKPYYILPDFDYNTHRKDFLDSAALKKMELFFADSRSLYAKHAKGVTERLADDDNTLHAAYDLLLNGYYTYELNASLGNDWKNLPADKRSNATRVLTPSGDYLLISGRYATPEEAAEYKNDWHTNGVSGGSKLIFIAPGEIKTVTE